MEAAEIIVMCEIWPEHLHLVVQAIVDDEGVSHSDAMRFHGVSLAIVVVADSRVIEVGHYPLLSLWPCCERVQSTLHDSLPSPIHLLLACLLTSLGDQKLSFPLLLESSACC